MIVFRVDASLRIGTGHVMRCLTIADQLRANGLSCRFITRGGLGSMGDAIRARGMDVTLLPKPVSDCATAPGDPPHAAWLGATWQTDAQETSLALRDYHPDWLVVDHYALDARWETTMRSACGRIMVVDDLADRAHDCDLLLDQYWHGARTPFRYDALAPQECRRLLGPRYALLGSEYGRLCSAAERDGRLSRVLIFMGGSDAGNETGKALAALRAPDLAHLEVDVVMGVSHPYQQALIDQAQTRPYTTLHGPLPSLAELMARADLMIGAGGATGLERLCMGLPAIVISIAENQRAVSMAFAREGLIDYLGDAGQVTAGMIADRLRWSLANPAELAARSRKAQRLVTGAGAIEVAAHILAARRDMHVA